MKSLRLGLIVLSFLCLSLSGCRSKVEYEKEGSVDLGAFEVFSIDGPKSNQKVKIEASAPDAISVFVVYDTDKPENPENLQGMEKVLAREMNKTSISLTVDIEAKKNFSVYVSGNKKKTTYKISIKSL